MKTKSWRHWYQFSVRTLFVVITLTGVFLGALLAPVARQRLAVQRVVKLGGSVEYESVSEKESTVVRQLRVWLPRDFFDSIIEIDFDSNEISQADLEAIQSLKQVEVLWLCYTNLTDSDVAYLQGFKKLKYVRIRGTRVSDRGIAELQAALPSCTIAH